MRKIHIGAYAYKEQRTPDDEAAITLFESKKNEFNFDVGGLSERYREAEKYNQLYGTDVYKAQVETYCVNCTNTELIKICK